MAGSFAPTAMAEPAAVGIELLAGRWIASRNEVEEGLLVVNEFGIVAFVGEPDIGDARLFLMPECDGAQFQLQIDGEHVCNLSVESSPHGVPDALVVDDDGSAGTERWRRLAVGSQDTAEEVPAPASPTAVRRKAGANFSR